MVKDEALTQWTGVRSHHYQNDFLSGLRWHEGAKLTHLHVQVTHELLIEWNSFLVVELVEAMGGPHGAYV